MKELKIVDQGTVICAGIKELLRLQYGIGNLMDVQNLEKSQRNKIIKELCDQGAGFRQLARITGISYGIIQRVVTDQRTEQIRVP